MIRFLSLLLLVALAACAQAVSQTPMISGEELKAEQAEQQAIIKQEQERGTASTEVQTRAQMLERLGKVGKPIATAGATVCKEETGQECNFPFALDKDDAPLNAYTDGKMVVVAPAMMKFAYTDTQLATVLSHEYAHAIMGHPGKTSQNAAVGGLLGMAVDSIAQSQGFGTGGTFSKIGQQGAVLRYSQDFEREADYIGLYVMARAGYEYKDAAAFWRRMATLNPDGIYSASTHPTTAERYLLLNKTAAEIDAKKAGGQPLLPQRLAKK